ncbi:phage holin family protein [Chryseobacterium sp. MFBS3-17]|uniref:phage holin family protein n=1 Tax=Chryseobacterium sp. MFBS3-17 TaxID=2886689 RepID=UPI001D0EFFF5|nr:phage holin family protein [Chryseobacterium sp. MFBS3-17]MCC2589923.1 phage holin family protein [Chryseobacterium sp. MFBS3-17]
MLNLLKDYTLKRADLLKLEATEKGLAIGSTLSMITLCAIFLIFFLALFNIAVAILIGAAINSYTGGFFIVAGVYFIALVILILAARPIKRIIANKLLNIFREEL